MNILLINNYCVPEIGASSHLYYSLGKELASRGNNVFYLTGIPRYNIDKLQYEKYLKSEKFFVEELEKMKVIRIKLPYVDRHKFIRRGIEHFEIAYKMYKYPRKFIENLKIDVSLVYSPPLTLYWTAKKIKEIAKIPFILNVQDLFPQASIDLGVLKNPILVNFFRKIEESAYDSANLITVHSTKNKKFVEKVCKNLQKVVVVENWIDENEIMPDEKINDFSRKYNIADKFVVSFAGTLGVSQDIEVILKAAKEIEKHENIVFLIVGDGIKKEDSLKMAREMKLKNVVFLPMQPKEVYPQILHSSDVSLATLAKEVKTPTVPSKILSIMSAGLPVIATMSLNGDAPDLIKIAECGYVFEAGDYKHLAETILLLYKNESLRRQLGKNGRKYIENYLSVKSAADKYEELFLELMKKSNKTI